MQRPAAPSHVPKYGLTFQVLDDAAQAVAMGSDEHPLASLDLGGDLLIPEGQRPGNGVLQAFTGGQLPRLQPCVPAVLEVEILSLPAQTMGPMYPRIPTPKILGLSQRPTLLMAL